jgi:hypothetical protein
MMNSLFPEKVVGCATKRQIRQIDKFRCATQLPRFPGVNRQSLHKFRATRRRVSDRQRILGSRRRRMVRCGEAGMELFDSPAFLFAEGSARLTQA